MADFDGDGVLDLYTGSFQGSVDVFMGLEGGGFAAPLKLLDKKGVRLQLGQFWNEEEGHWEGAKTSTYPDELGIAAAAVDWDEDGDLDLILGAYKGKLYLRSNLGTAKVASFSTDDVLLMSGDKALEVPTGHAIPVVADWDGDGLFDLLSGSDCGAVVWFRNIGERGKPSFAPAYTIVKASNEKADTPGKRTQVHVCDFDADGQLDLLMGDYRSAKNAAGKSEHHGYVWWFRRLPEIQ